MTTKTSLSPLDHHRQVGKSKSLKKQNIALFLGFVILILAPLALNQKAEYSGADGQAKAQIEQTAPGYKPWFTPIWTPPSGEIESLLFAAQASIGTGIIAFYVGYMRGKKKGAEHR